MVKVAPLKSALETYSGSSLALTMLMQFFRFFPKPYHTKASKVSVGNKQEIRDFGCPIIVEGNLKIGIVENFSNTFSILAQEEAPRGMSLLRHVTRLDHSHLSSL